MTLIVDDLERKCRGLVHRWKKHPATSPLVTILREIALVLVRIDALRTRDKSVSRRLLAKELELHSLIMNIELRTDLLPDWLERLRLKQRLQRTLDRHSAEAERLMTAYEAEIQQLQKRLLELWNMHDQLSEYGDATTAR